MVHLMHDSSTYISTQCFQLFSIFILRRIYKFHTKLKTFLEQYALPFVRNFSFCHNVFCCRCIKMRNATEVVYIRVRLKENLWCMMHFIYIFNPLPHIDAFWRLYSRQLFENIVTKEEIAQNEQFLLLPQCFPLLVIGYMRERVNVWLLSTIIFLSNCLTLMMSSIFFWHGQTLKHHYSLITSCGIL